MVSQLKAAGCNIKPSESQGNNEANTKKHN